MINWLFPHYTYRRLVVSSLARLRHGPGAIQERLRAKNWRTYLEFRKREFTCNVCGVKGFPFFDFPDLKRRKEHEIGHLRETLQCKSCGSTMRHRTLAAMFLQVVSQRVGKELRSVQEIDVFALKGLQILDTDAFSPMSTLLRHMEGYFVSSFRPDLPFDKEIEPNHLNIDLEDMGLPPNSFDIILTSDVMEHVRHCDKAHEEIARVLSPGGNYIFTVPYSADIPTHRVLVETQGDEDIFLVDPHYHGDPLTGGILAYRVFGRQIFADLENCGLDASLHYLDQEDALIINGDIFLATKNVPETTVKKIAEKKA